MNIHELPIDKLRQCFENESERLNQIQKSLLKANMEYEQKRDEFRNILSDLEDKCIQLEAAQESAHTFLTECKNRVKELES